MIGIDLREQVAWVTGGNSGIGAATVGLLHAAGARVVSADVAYERDLVEAADGILHARIDVRDSAGVVDAAARLAAAGWVPTILVNNAGIARDAISWKLADADWAEVIDVNLTGAFRMSRAVVPWLRASRRGAILNVSSINGLRGKVGQANYAAAKAGLIGLTRTLALELGRDGIRVNAVAPGLIDTPLTRKLPEAVRQRALGETLLGRLGRPEDVAAAILYLVSPLAAHITGQVLAVDGGQASSAGIFHDSGARS